MKNFNYELLKEESVILALTKKFCKGKVPAGKAIDLALSAIKSDISGQKWDRAQIMPAVKQVMEEIFGSKFQKTGKSGPVSYLIDLPEADALEMVKEHFHFGKKEAPKSLKESIMALEKREARVVCALITLKVFEEQRKSLSLTNLGRLVIDKAEKDYGIIYKSFFANYAKQVITLVSEIHEEKTGDGIVRWSIENPEKIFWKILNETSTEFVENSYYKRILDKTNGITTPEEEVEEAQVIEPKVEEKILPPQVVKSILKSVIPEYIWRNNQDLYNKMVAIVDIAKRGYVTFQRLREAVEETYFLSIKDKEEYKALIETIETVAKVTASGGFLHIEDPEGIFDIKKTKVKHVFRTSATEDFLCGIFGSGNVINLGKDFLVERNIGEEGTDKLVQLYMKDNKVIDLLDDDLSYRVGIFYETCLEKVKIKSFSGLALQDL